MRSRSVRLYHDHMLTKEPGTRARTPWHQDQPYYNVDGRQNVSFWIPVDPVRRHRRWSSWPARTAGPG
jgi:ectoine hydroxylase-related dioxygenase (phytanoyl-CoA dioxygenase family)